LPRCPQLPRSRVKSERSGPSISSPFLQELADATGGDIYRTRNAADLRDAFARILSEFRTRYLLTYSPQGVDKGGWHPIEVKLKNKKVKVTARRGYQR
jgi:VWFA-related protein